MHVMKKHTKWKCKKNCKNSTRGKCSNYFKRIEYCFGKGLELLSASLVLAVCQDSKVFRIRKFPLSITLALLKSIEWLLCQAWAAILEPVLVIYWVQWKGNCLKLITSLTPFLLGPGPKFNNQCLCLQRLKTTSRRFFCSQKVKSYYKLLIITIIIITTYKVNTQSVTLR